MSRVETIADGVTLYLGDSREILLTVTFQNDNPNTIWNVLARKLGREPTNAEAAAEVKRILTEANCELADAGKLRHQRGLLPWTT